MVNVILQRAGAEAVDDADAGKRGHVGFVEKAVDLVFGVGGGKAYEVELGGDVGAVYVAGDRLSLGLGSVFLAAR